MQPLAAAASALTLCLAPTHHDGDAIRCLGQSRSMRLYGIDAPEMPGACRPGRRCTPGDPLAARDHLRDLTRGRKVMCETIDRDHYGRDVVRCSADGVDLSCAMVADGYAVRRYGDLECGGQGASPSAPPPAHTRPPTPLLACALYLAVINALTYLSFREDKRRAMRFQRRIRERHLLALAAFGGSPAAIYAQQTLRHKTTKQPFATQLLVIVGLHIGVLAGLVIIALD